MFMFSYSNTLHEFSESEKGNYKKRGYKYRTLVFPTRPGEYIKAMENKYLHQKVVICLQKP